MTELLLLRDDRHRVRIAPEMGGGIASFDALLDDRPVPVLRPWGGVETGPFGLACNLLLPFSNRISGGGFFCGGVFCPVPPNLAGEALPIHGDGFQKAWAVDEASAVSVTLSLPDGEIGPYRYRAKVRYALAGGGFACRLTMTNVADLPLPYGGGFHPWFPRHGSTTLKFSADRVWTEDEHHLPQEQVGLSDRPEWDFAMPARLPADWINNGFTGWGRARHNRTAGIGDRGLACRQGAARYGDRPIRPMTARRSSVSNPSAMRSTRSTWMGGPDSWSLPAARR